MVTAPTSPARKTILFHLGAPWGLLAVGSQTWLEKTQTGGVGTCSKAMEEAQCHWLCRLKIFRKFLGQAAVFVRWEGKESIPHTRRFPAQPASPSCLFQRYSVFSPG